MSKTFPTINSHSKINLVAQKSDYANPGTGDGTVGYVLGYDGTAWSSPKNIVVVTSYGEYPEDAVNPLGVLGRRVDHVIQGNNQVHKARKVIGYVNLRGEKFGVVPDKALPHYVMK